MKSHILLPASIINSFGHKEKIISENGKINKANYVYVLKYKKSEIEMTKVIDYGSEEGYFNESIESVLSKKYETPFGDIRKHLIDFSKKKTETIVFTKEDFQVLKDYLKMLLYRSKYFYNLYCDNSLIGKYIRTTPSDYVGLCLDTNVEPLPDFHKYSLTIVVAKGSRHFVNNFGGFSFINPYKPITNERMYFVPVSPSCGILFFIPKSDKEDDKYVDLLIANSDEVLYFNKQIAITETIFEKDSLIAIEENELRELIDTFN